MHIWYTTPTGGRTYRSGNQCDTLAGSWRFLHTELSRGLRRGLRPSSTPGLNTEHPCRGASLADPGGCAVLSDESDKSGGADDLHKAPTHQHTGIRKECHTPGIISRETIQQRTPKGSLLHSPRSRHEVPMTPGNG